jgi:hypothetical protein
MDQIGASSSAGGGRSQAVDLNRIDRMAQDSFVYETAFSGSVLKWM